MNPDIVKNLSAEQLRALFDSNMLGLTFWDRTGRITEANDYVLNLIGYSREELYGGKIRWDLMTPLEFMDREKQAFAELAAHGVCRPFEKEYIHKNGTRVPILIGGAYFAGKNTGGVSYLLDFTERQRQLAEIDRQTESLRRAEMLYRTMFEQTPMGIAVYEPSGKALTANKSWFEMWDATPELFADLNIREHPEIHRTGQKYYVEMAFAGEAVLVPPFHYTPLDENAGHPLWVEGQLYPIKDLFGNVREVVATHRDVTAQKEAEEQLAAVARENARLYAEATEALAARDEFLSIASHELKTPLTSLHMALQILTAAERRDDVKLTAAQIRELVTTCESQSRRVTTLVNELLDLTRVRSGRFEVKRSRFDLTALANEVVTKMSDASPNASAISVVCDGSLFVEWDNSRFEQVLTNLLSNALRYGKGNPITVKLWHGGTRTFITVADRGVGIAPEDRERIFKRFERSSSTRNIGGLGLGLYIVRKIVEAHGGEIRVESEPGRGSVFTLEVPTCPNPS